MAPTQDQRYDPVPPIPTYDEAVAGGSAWHHDVADSPTDQHHHDPDHRHTTEAEAEGQSLLTRSRHAFESSSTPTHQPTTTAPGGARRPPRGYHPPTVETDDESNLFSSDSDSDSDAEREAEHVRREMQELEIDDSGVHGGGRGRSSWGKRIGLALPQWRWRWRWRLPALRRGGAAGGSAGGSGSGGDGGAAAAPEEGPRASWASSWLARAPALPKFGSPALLLLVARTVAVFVVLGLLYLVFSSDMFNNMARRMGSQMYDPESVRNHVQGSIDARRIRDHLRHFTGYAHVAGTAGDFALMEDTEMLFRKYGLEDVRRDVYHVYLNYPKAGGRAVEVLGKGGKVTWSAKWEWEVVAGVKRPTPAFHGHSKSGDVKGRLVYAHYGLREDFQLLKDRGINLNGVIALVRHYGPQHDIALKVKAAEEAGAVGCITYSDPADDGSLKATAASGDQSMPTNGVQNGTVSLLSWVVGDVLTPGWGSKENLPRMKLDQTKGLVKIPSLPLTWRDAQALLQRLKGSGQRVPEQWIGGVPDVSEWWTGDSSSPIVRLKNVQDEVEKQPIWNVYGRITGIEQGEKKVIIGNHRDSWAFPAVGPHSGTAIMLEIARILGDLVGRGWRPLRTIEFASWDAQEYNLIGSTEYVEQNDEALRRDALAYINLDKAVSGDTFHAAGSPVFRKLLLQILNRVADPHFNSTLRERWDRRKGEIEGLDTDSDYVPFQNIAGTSSLDIHFGDDKSSHRAIHQNFQWMDNFGDPGFIYHDLLGQVLGLLILELSNRPILPFDIPAYANNLVRWTQELESWAGLRGGKTPSFEKLKLAVKEVIASVREFIKWEANWEHSVLASSGWEPSGLGSRRCDYNARMGKFETDLLDLAGIPGRTQFKHVVFGPQAWSRDPEAYFPSIRDAIVSGNMTEAQLTVDGVASILTQAAVNLGK
ncbi:hypothetical protein F5144DRAFT_612700 [Chaetomium tenue]|uniref:Uncharacterized protein n=1 Tax=Chaetomium tenue TaxID=1854479 RepID=A0ACB7PCC3_9PEZI|nr:hypothetical protein F5144DRAFT_612700 [Chaetomium globosum]